MTSLTLFEELINRNIKFIDDNDDTVLHFYSTPTKFTINCEQTNWVNMKAEYLSKKSKYLSKKSKYYSLANIKDNLYNGDIFDGELKNMSAVLFKIKVRDGCLASIIRKYILMIIDNPEFNDYNPENTENRYYLVIYAVDRIGAYNISLRFIDILKSNI